MRLSSPSANAFALLYLADNVKYNLWGNPCCFAYVFNNHFSSPSIVLTLSIDITPLLPVSPSAPSVLEFQSQELFLRDVLKKIKLSLKSLPVPLSSSLMKSNRIDAPSGGRDSLEELQHSIRPRPASRPPNPLDSESRRFPSTGLPCALVGRRRGFRWRREQIISRQSKTTVSSSFASKAVRC